MPQHMQYQDTRSGHAN